MEVTTQWTTFRLHVLNAISGRAVPLKRFLDSSSHKTPVIDFYLSHSPR
jgi:hypothetical protein